MHLYLSQYKYHKKGITVITTSTIYKNTKNVNDDYGKLDAAMEVAAFLEQVGAFAFDNWIDGELVYGPAIEKYYVTIKLMFPKKMPPNPAVFERLTNLECIIEFDEDTYKRVALIRDDNVEPIEYSADNGFHKKIFEHKVWIVTLRVPQRYLSLDGNTVFNIDGEDIYYSDIEAIYQGEEEAEASAADEFGGGSMASDMGGSDEEDFGF